jgi:hypothetical protein
VYATTSRPAGQPTRGKTAPNRLRRLDAFLALWAGPGLWHLPGPVVDLGFGREPITTLELAERFWRHDRRLEVIGVELDAERVAAAEGYARPGLRFLRGGFNVALPRPARLIRALNVLRQYEESAVSEAWAQMAGSLGLGGLLVEGTCSPTGSIMVVNLLRQTDRGLRLEGLLFSTRLGREGSDPEQFPQVLPKQLIHRMIPGEPIHAFFEDWRRAARQTGSLRTWGACQHFVAAGQLLADRHPGVLARPRLLRRGFLLWQSPPL